MWKRAQLILLVVLVASAATFLTAACGTKEGARISSGERPRLLLLLNVNSNEFFRKIEEGFRLGMTPAMRDKYDLDVRYCLKPSDAAFQRGVLDRYIADFVDGKKDPVLKAVVMTPAGSGDEVTHEIHQLREKNIPVVLVDLPIKPAALARAQTDYNAFIGTENRQGAILAANEMIRCLPEGGSVLVLNGVPGMEVAKDRRAGFIERLTDIGKKAAVAYKITEKSADFLRSQARSAMDDLLTMGQTFDGVFAANDEMALGALESLTKHDAQSKTAVIGFDAIEEAQSAVSSGRMAATIAQDPVGMGQRAAQTIDKLLSGQSVEKEQLLKPKIVSRHPSIPFEDED